MGPGAFLFAFQPTARLSLPIPSSSWRRPCNQRNPGPCSQLGGHCHMHVFETSHRRVFSMGLCKKVALHPPPTIFDSLMTRRGLGGCDPQRDRGGGGKREGASHLLGRADSCFLLPLPRFPHCLPEGFNLSSRFFQAFANPMSERGERDGRCWGSVSWTSAGPSTRTACRFMRGALRMGPDTHFEVKSATSVTSLNRVLGFYLWTTTP